MCELLQNGELDLLSKVQEGSRHLCSLKTTRITAICWNISLEFDDLIRAVNRGKPIHIHPVHKVLCTAYPTHSVVQTVSAVVCNTSIRFNTVKQNKKYGSGTTRV